MRTAATCAVWLLMYLASAGTVRAQDSNSTDVLVQDAATSATWRTVRGRLPADFSDLREQTRRGGDGAGMRVALEVLDRDIGVFAGQARILAPDELEAVQQLVRRIERQLDHLAIDYANHDAGRIATSLELLDASLAGLEALAAESDLAAGRARSGELEAAPADWGTPRYPAPEARAGLALLTGREIREEIALRRDQLLRASPSEARVDGEALAREIGELARGLLRRQGEVEVLSRPGLRNTALRMEVLAENMVDYLRSGDRANFRRQVISLGDTLEEVDGYFAVQQPPVSPVSQSR